MSAPSVTQLLIILAIVVLLFGAKKIPELAKGLGGGIKSFKKAMKEDDEGAENAEIVEGEIVESEPKHKKTTSKPKALPKTTAKSTTKSASKTASKTATKTAAKTRTKKA